MQSSSDGTARRLVARRPFLVFYLLALAIVVVVIAVRLNIPNADDVYRGLFEFMQEHGLYANVYSIGRYAFAKEGLAFSIFVFAGAPTLAALLVSIWRGGIAGLRDLLDRFRPWRDGVARADGIRVYVQLALLYGAGVLFYLVATGLVRGRPGIEQILAGVGGALPLLLLWLVIGPFLDEGGSLEELGWRGFALPILLDRMRSPLVATFLLGVLWWAWHLPREVPSVLAGVAWAPYLRAQMQFLLLCVCLSILITFFWLRTGGSVWPAVLIHGFTNVWSKALGGPLNGWSRTDVRSLLVFAMALGVLFHAEWGIRGIVARLRPPASRGGARESRPRE